MRIVAERSGGRYVLVDLQDGDGFVLDSQAEEAGRRAPLGELRAQPGWLDYRGPQNIARRLSLVEMAG